MKINSILSNLAAPAFSLLLFASCESDNHTTDDGPIAVRITSTIAGANHGTVASLPTPAPSTRASESAWMDGDRIGVSTTSTEGLTAYTNIQYTATGTGGDFIAVNAAGEDNTIYFQDKKPIDFTAYYPYTGANGTRPGTDGIISRTLTAADQLLADLPKTDYLWSNATGITSANPNVNFTFTHRMSRLKLNFVEGSGMDFPTAGLTYTLDGLKQAGSFNTLNGTAAADAAATAAKLENIHTDISAQSSTSTLILWPQEAATAQLTVFIEGIPYAATLQLLDLPATTPAVQGLAAGYSYAYNVKVHKTGIEISGAQITPWTQGTGGDVDAKEEI